MYFYVFFFLKLSPELGHTKLNYAKRLNSLPVSSTSTLAKHFYSTQPENRGGSLDPQHSARDPPAHTSPAHLKPGSGLTWRWRLDLGLGLL